MKFNEGDVVRLLSGGPLMTVLRKSDVASIYLLVWHEDRAIRTGEAPEVALRLATNIERRPEDFPLQDRMPGLRWTASIALDADGLPIVGEESS